MGRLQAPRRGSLGFSPRKRAKKETPRILHWPQKGQSGPLGFAGYKAGMTHAVAVDHTDNSLTSGSEVVVPVTVVEAPPLLVVGVRAYSKGYFGKETSTDVILHTKKTKQKKKGKEDPKSAAQKLDQLKDVSDITIIAATQPSKTSMPKKNPDLMEIALGGSVQDKLNYAKERFGGEIKASEILKDNTYSDVVAVTKGKGHEGPMKRWGIRKQPRKSTGRRRHIGTGGAWSPSRKLWLEPQGGQVGYHRRTEYNKLILKVGKDGADVNPKGGFLRYGPLKNDYIIVYGSVPGPTKRLVRFTAARRPAKAKTYEITSVVLKSKQGA